MDLIKAVVGDRIPHANAIVAAHEEWAYSLCSLWVILLAGSAKNLLVGCPAG
jgi:hypothetical protein